MRTLVILLCACGCAATGPARGTPVVRVDRMSDTTGPAVIEIPAGTRLPVDVAIRTPFAHAEGGRPAFHLVVDRTVYWYPPQPHLVSLDGKTWRRFRDLYRGSVSVSLSRTATSGPRAAVTLAAEDR